MIPMKRFKAGDIIYCADVNAMVDAIEDAQARAREAQAQTETARGIWASLGGVVAATAARNPKLSRRRIFSPFRWRTR